MNSPASTLDQLIRFHEGADYFREPEEDDCRVPLWRGLLPLIFATWALLGAAGYCLYQAVVALQ